MKRKLAALGIALLMPLTMAAKCDVKDNTDSPKSDKAGTVVRKQHQPKNKDNKVERWCIHVKRTNSTKIDILCSIDKNRYYNKYSVESKYP